MENQTVQVERLSVIIKRLGWRFHAGLVVYIVLCAVVAGYFSFDYFEAAGPAGAALIVLVLRYWTVFSTKMWFWWIVFFLIVLQVPIVMACQGLANRYQAVFMFFEGLLDFMFMDFVVMWISPKTVELA